jgi:sensor domain CHASE-containing protein
MIQGPSLQLPWWDSQLFGSAVIGLVVAASHWLTNRKQNTIKSVVDDTHTLVNSQMGTQLKVNVASALALYELTKKPEHLQLLNDAKQALDYHNQKQALVDSGKGESQ